MTAVEAEAGARILSAVAEERVSPVVMERLYSIAALFGEDLRIVAEELEKAVHDGVPRATDAAAHLLAAGGKRVRPMTVLLAAACFGPIAKPARELAVVAELVHLATLLHDDVVDDGMDRRGLPASRLLWGNAVSVLAGDLLLTHSLERTSAVGNAPVLSALFKTLRSLVDGEIIQLRGRTALDPSEETYWRIIEGKTASLFGWACSSGAIINGADAEQATALRRFGEEMGMAFQIVDDVIDFSGENTGKRIFNDLREGKMTLPVIRLLARDSGSRTLVDAARAGEEPAARDIGDRLRKSGILESTRKQAEERVRDATRDLESLPKTEARELLAEVALELTSRRG